MVYGCVKYMKGPYVFFNTNKNSKAGYGFMRHFCKPSKAAANPKSWT